MLTISSLKKEYTDNPVLQGVDLHIPRGEITGVLGENGAGKTTLFRIISNLIVKYSGSLYINGENIKTCARSQVSVFFGGSSGLYNRMSARENIIYFARLNKINSAQTESGINYFSQLLQMEEYIDRKTMNFSHGMKQKTALVRMAIIDSPIMLFDEPTTGMDFPSIESVVKFIHIQKNNQKTILYSSHNITELVRVCDRILILHKGVIAADIPLTSNLDKSARLIENEYLKVLNR